MLPKTLLAAFARKAKAEAELLMAWQHPHVLRYWAEIRSEEGNNGRPGVAHSYVCQSRRRFSFRLPRLPRVLLRRTRRRCESQIAARSLILSDRFDGDQGCGWFMDRSETETAVFPRWLVLDLMDGGGLSNIEVVTLRDLSFQD